MKTAKEWQKWITDTALKTVKTMAQSALGIIGTTLAIGDVDWVLVASASGLAGIVCILMNIANLEMSENEG